VNKSNLTDIKCEDKEFRALW